MKGKSTTEEIRERFDADVERFSNLETGQAATIDAPLAMELITEAAIAATPSINRVLDYIDKEDSPRSLTYQLNLLREVGFDSTEVLHKNSCFAAFGAVKASTG